MVQKKNIKKMFPWMILSFFIFFAVQIVNLIPAYVMAYIVDVAIPGGDLGQIVLYVLLFVAVPLLSGVGNSYYVYITAIQCRVYAFHYNSTIVEKLLRQDMAFHNANAAGELSAKAIQEVSNYVYLWICTIPQAVASVLTSAAILAAVGSINIWVAVVQLLFVAALIFPVRYGGKLVKQNSQRLFGAIVKGRAIVSEAFGGIRTVKTMGLENRILQRYKDTYQQQNAIFGRAIAVETVTTSGIRNFLSAVFLGIAFIQCAVYVSVGSLTLGLLVTVLNLLPRFYTGVADLIGANLSLKKELGQYDEILSYLELETEDESGQTPPAFLAQSLALRDVCYAYEPGREVLQHFDCTVPKGTWLGMEGKSGGGKSTVIDLLLRLYRPDSGALTLDGVPAEQLSLPWYRSNIAYVPQEPFLFHGTVRENIELMCGPVHPDKLEQALKGANICDFITALPQGLDTPIGDNGVAISGGEKQRLAVAIALLQERPLLLLDEATSNMDRESEEHVRDYLRRRIDETGLTVVSVSHRKAFHSCADTVLTVGPAVSETAAAEPMQEA